MSAVRSHQPDASSKDGGSGAALEVLMGDVTADWAPRQATSEREARADAEALLTTIISARDESVHIARCIRSALQLGPVFVVDSGSLDDTVTIAGAQGAEVVEHAWEGYACQKNWALENVPLRTEWVLLLDADEYVTPTLREEIVSALSDTERAGFYLPRQNVFLGRTLRHAWWYPDYQMRLFRHARGRFENRSVHEHVIVDGSEGFLRQPLMHENLKGIDAFVSRHLAYAGLEAREIENAREGVQHGQRKGRLLGTWPERRRALKTRVWYRLSGRPVIRFLWMYVVKRGFLDGRQGLLYSQLIACHEVFIEAKRLEQRVNAGDC